METQRIKHVLIEGTVIHGLFGEQIAGKGIIHGLPVGIRPGKAPGLLEGMEEIANTLGSDVPRRLEEIAMPGVEGEMCQQAAIFPEGL